jgi:hypothetical protein
MRIMPLPTRMLLAFIAAFVGPFMISMLAPAEAEAAHGTGTTYDVGGLEVTTYYTPVESYYVRDCVQTIQVWPDFSTSGSKVTAGPYPCSFVSHTKGEGSGKLTSGVYAGSYLNWSYEGLGPNGDQQGFWIDTCPRDSYGGCLQAKVSAAVSENLAQNFGLRRGETFHLENCGTEAANTTACDYFRSGNWIVNDQFTTGIASDKQIDLYYGEQESAGFRNSAYWLTMYDATIRVNPPPDYEPPDTVAPKGTIVINGGATSTANPTNTTGNVDWTVTFSESVTGVDMGDFALANNGLGGSPAISSVTQGANASVYTVTASTGSGSGTLGLDLRDDDSIEDGANNPLGGTGLGNGDFDGEVYTLDRTAPTVTATPSRNADHNGRYDAPFEVSFSATDTGGSGNVSCDPEVNYSGPDTNGDSISGSCTDEAGNSASATFAFKYDATAPNVSSISPATIAPSANVSATFSEAMDARTTDGDPSTINATTFKLLRLNADGTTTKVTAAVSYAAATKKAILNPSSNLSLGRTYEATVTSGTQDLAGNALDQNPNIAGNQSKSWKFTVR